MSSLASCTSEGAMARKYGLKNGARVAFYEAQSSEAIQRALNHKTRVQPREWKPGDLVYVYRASTKKGKKGVDQWLGPCTVIGPEGSNFWLARGGRCLLAAPQHLRPAEHEEVSETLRIKAALREAQQALDQEFEEYLDVREQEHEDIEMPAMPVEEEEIPENEPQPRPRVATLAEKRKEVQAEEQRLKKAARQVKTLDDLPMQFRQTGTASSSSVNPEGNGKPREAFYTKKFGSTDPKALEKEIPWNLIPENEKQLFREAEEKQWTEHVEFGAVKPLSVDESNRVEQEFGRDRILPARFLYRDKNLAKRRDDASIPCKAKARLCVGGQRDPDLGQVQMSVDAPTANRFSLLVGLHVALARGWVVSIGDIRAAFLNGVEAPRNLFFRQPARGIPGLAPGQLVEILKGVFGLSTSPKLWWLKLSKDLLSLKVKGENGEDYVVEQNEVDPCAFRVCQTQLESGRRPHAHGRGQAAAIAEGSHPVQVSYRRLGE